MLNEDVKQKEDKLEIYIPNGPRLGDKVIEMEGVSKGYGDRILFENLTFKLPPAGIIGVIGPNGAGKTTLFRLIMKQAEADAGKIEIGDTVKISYVDQTHKAIDPEKSVFRSYYRRNRIDDAGKQT
jgi:energy-dependent translational throttle protein EttA